MRKNIDAEKLIAEIERLSEQYGDTVFDNAAKAALEKVYSIISSLQQEQPGCVEKTARISPGMLSNFGTSTYVLDVDFTQDEMAKIAPFGFNSGKIKIKIVCE